jgi:hypothetical protein
MDPDQALANAREAYTEYVKATDAGDTDRAEDEAERLATAFDALDGWISRGGFLPKAWHNSRT